MSSTTGLVLLCHVSRNRQHVKSVSVELSILSRGLHALAAVYDSNFPVQSTIWALSLRRSLVELEDFGIGHLSNQVINFFDSSLKWLISSAFSKYFSNTFLFGWFSNCSTSRLTVSLRFMSTCSMVECGMPGIRKSMLRYRFSCAYPLRFHSCWILSHLG